MSTASSTNSTKYDFIIAGGGLAGLSLAYYLNESSLRNAKLLIIDHSEKKENDKTWCFWEARTSQFETIIRQKWNGVWFHGSGGFNQFLPIDEYSYKLIRSEDFYQFIQEKLRQNPNITFLKAGVVAIQSVKSQATEVVTTKGIFEATELVFDSTHRSSYDDIAYSQMLQHFVGWVIETPTPTFDETKPTMFDFRVEQHNECRFVYVLPYSRTEALIEFTIFSDNLLSDQEYEAALKEYIYHHLKISEYQIKEIEKGIIPMSDEPHHKMPLSRVVRIGTSGGYVKASTGYSFTRTQRYLQQLVAELESVNGSGAAFEEVHFSWKKAIYIPNWKSLLDSILLEVMLRKRYSSKGIFTRLFSKNRPAQILKFLDEDTSLFEDLAIMTTVPIIPFVKSALVVIFRKIRHILR